MEYYILRVVDQGDRDENEEKQVREVLISSALLFVTVKPLLRL